MLPFPVAQAFSTSFVIGHFQFIFIGFHFVEVGGFAMRETSLAIHLRG